MHTTLHRGDGDLAPYQWTYICEAVAAPVERTVERTITFDPNHWQGRVKVPAEMMARIAKAFTLLDDRCAFDPAEGFVARLALPHADYDRWRERVQDGTLIMSSVFQALSPGWVTFGRQYVVTELRDWLVTLWRDQGLDGSGLVYDEPF